MGFGEGAEGLEESGFINFGVVYFSSFGVLGCLLFLSCFVATLVDQGANSSLDNFLVSLLLLIVLEKYL